jgi:hypothetical protein
VVDDFVARLDWVGLSLAWIREKHKTGKPETDWMGVWIDGRMVSCVCVCVYVCTFLLYVIRSIV